MEGVYKSLMTMSRAPAAAQRTYVLGAVGGFTTMAYVTWATISKDSEYGRAVREVQRARADRPAQALRRRFSPA
jgi:hypothetical protein